MPKYPEAVITLGDLRGPDGNAYVILGKVDRALADAGVGKAEREEYQRDATSGDYEHLLQVTQDTVAIAVLVAHRLYGEDLLTTMLDDEEAR